MKFIQHTKVIKATSHREYVIQECRDDKKRILSYTFVSEKRSHVPALDRYYERLEFNKKIKA